MPYDVKNDYADYMGGANDYAHARMAKKLVDAKRAAKMGGGEGMGGDAHDAGVMSEAGETSMPPGGDGDGDEGMDAGPVDGAEGMGGDAPPMPGGEGGGKVPFEATPEEIALIEKMRAAKQGAPDDAGQA